MKFSFSFQLLLFTFYNKTEHNTNVKRLQEEMDQKLARIKDLEKQLDKYEEGKELPVTEQELEELEEILNSKKRRIFELEEALRESLRITTEREVVMKQEEVRRQKIVEKVILFCENFSYEKNSEFRLGFQTGAKIALPSSSSSY